MQRCRVPHRLWWGETSDFGGIVRFRRRVARSWLWEAVNKTLAVSAEPFFNVF